MGEKDDSGHGAERMEAVGAYALRCLHVFMEQEFDK